MTNDLSQCGNCIYHYTYNGRDMCKQVGDDFYLQWKVEDCPYHTTITSATKISDEIYRLRAENAALRERLEKAVELPCELGSHLFTIEKRYEFITYGAVQYSVENIYCAGEIVVCEDGLFRFYTPTYHPRCLVFGKDIFTTREAAEARLAEMKGGKK